MWAIINRGFLGVKSKVRLACPCVSSAPHLRGLGSGEPRHDRSAVREEIDRGNVDFQFGKRTRELYVIEDICRFL